MAILSNARHERFAQELAKGKTADEAYQLAGFKANRGNATTLKANQSISDRVTEILAKSEERTLVTIESITAELDEARIHAMKDPKGAAAAVSATMGKAKLHGLLVERSEVTGKDGKDLIPEDGAGYDLARRIAYALSGNGKPAG